MNRLVLLVVCVALVGVLGSVSEATSIFWDDGDGNTGTFTSATWNNLQTALTNAQNTVATAGLVKVEGNLQRAAGDATTGDLKIPTGNITVSGGWDAGFTTQGAKSTLDVNGSNTANNRYRVLTITGATTTVDNFVVTKGRPPADGTSIGFGAGIYVSGDNSKLQRLQVTNNIGYDQYSWSQGGGICVNGAAGVRISNSEISNNSTPSSGGGIAVLTAGTVTNPVVIETCTITGNSSGSNGYAGGGIEFSSAVDNSPKGFLVVANSKIVNNQATNGSGVNSNCYTPTNRLTIYGSLISGNYSNSAAGQGNGFYGGSRATTVLANCTIADNTNPTQPGQYGIYATGSSWSAPGRVIFINSISATNNTGMYDRRRESGSGGQDYIDFLRSTVSEANYYEADSDGNLNSTSLLAALSTVGNVTPGYWSRNDSGTLTNNIEQNIDGNPSFVGGGNYQLTPGSNSVDNALLKGTAYKYLDINFSNSYDAMVDIIVAGTPPPTGNHLVYLTDLLGNPRFDSAIGLMDRGAYELQVMIPEPPALGILLLGLPLLRRRRS